MRRLPRAGFTLSEALVTLALVAIVLAVAGDLCKDYADTMRWTAGKDAALMGPYEVVERVRCELVGAVEVISPAPRNSAPSSELRFRRVDPTSLSRLPDPLPSPLPSRWDPLDGAWVARVRYFVQGGFLQREVTFPDGQVACQAAAEDVAGFAVRWVGDGAWEIRASFRDERLVKTVSSLALTRASQ